MIFRRKKPKRLYYPTKSTWYKKPRRKRTVIARRPSKSMRFLKTMKFQHTIWIFIASLFIIAGVLFYMAASHFRVTAIEIHRESFDIDSGAIEHHLQEFKKKNILFLSSHRIEKNIRENFPEFEFVTIKKKLPETLEIHLNSYEIVANVKAYYVLPEPEFTLEGTEYMNEVEEALEAAFTLDKEEEEPEEVEQKGLLNAVGQVLFDKEEDLDRFTITVKELDQPLEDRQQVILPSKLNYILEALALFNNLFEIEVESIYYFPVSREMHLKTRNGFSIWLAMEKKYEDQLEKFAAIYKPAELEKESIRYIDLRVKEKVIYCPQRAHCDNPK